MNAMPPGTQASLVGDFNIYSGSEPAFTKLLESQVNNIGRLYDPLGFPLSNWNSVASLAPQDTQCPCLTCPTGSGFSGGGLDDRFDMFLPTYAMNDGLGLELIPSTYKPVGNDGLHFNGNITDAPTIPEGAAYASALWNASDHLPIRTDLRVPALIAVAPPTLNFGNVIVGGPATMTVQVSDPATAPAEDVNYSFSATGGFIPPGGSFSKSAGQTPANHGIDMNTASAGLQSGNLTVTSNVVDQPTSNVALSGTVLDHADASLDSLLSVSTETLDFGTQASGGYTPLLTRVHNRGYNALRAHLAVTAATINGGAGHFSIVGGFSPVAVGETAASFQVQFDDAGATPDSTYDATLTFTSADEPLPGAAPQPDLIVNLTARPAAGPAATPPSIPTPLRFNPPRPNPMSDEAWFGFDLPHGAPVSPGSFDLAGPP